MKETQNNKNNKSFSSKKDSVFSIARDMKVVNCLGKKYLKAWKEVLEGLSEGFRRRASAGFSPDINGQKISRML